MKPLTSHFSLPAPSFTFAGFSWPRWVASLPKGDKGRRVRQHKQPVCGPYYHAPRPEQAGKGTGFYLADSSAPFHLRWQYCDKVEGVRIRHTGWFADDYQDDKFRGLVFTLPKGRGFLAGWTMGEGMSSFVERDIYETAEDAAYAADSLAEDAAEDERESREKMEQEEREAEEARESEALESALFCNA